MWPALRLSLKHGKKIIHFSELLLSSFFLTHNLKNYFFNTNIEIFKKLSSEELLLLMENKLVNIFDKETHFVGNGLFLNEIVVVNSIDMEKLMGNAKDSNLKCRFFKEFSTDDHMDLELIDFKEDDKLAIYKIKNSFKTKPIDIRYREPQEGEKLLVYSPKDESNFLLQDTYLLKKNILKYAYQFPLHKVSKKNNNPVYSDIVFDYYGNFQGYIPPETQYLLKGKDIYFISERFKTKNNIEKLSLGISLASINSELNNTPQLIVSNIEPDSLAKKNGIKTGDIIETINGIKLKTVEDLAKILGYSYNTQIEILINRKGIKNMILIKI